MKKSKVYLLILLISIFLIFALTYEKKEHRISGNYFKKYAADDIEIYKGDGSFGIKPRIFLLAESKDKFFVIQRRPVTVGIGSSIRVAFGPCAYFVVDTKKEEELVFARLSDIEKYADPMTNEKLFAAANLHCVETSLT